MAGDWVKFRKDLPDDPAVLGMSQKLRATIPEVVLKLMRFWAWADAHTETGFIKSATPEWLDDYVRQPGFAEAMTEEGWLEVDVSGLTIPNFLRHNGASAKKRLLDARRQSKSRSKSRKCHKNVTKASDESHADSSLLSSTRKGTRKGAPDDALFEEFWRAFPPGRRQKKGKARAAWSRAITKAAPEVIISSAAEYAASPTGRGRFVQGPEPWLNGECWDDDRNSWQRDDGITGHAGPVLSDKTRRGLAAVESYAARMEEGDES